MAAYAYLAWPKIHDWRPTAIIAILGGTYAAALLASFIGLFTSARDRGALRRARDGAPFQDGRLESASGPIRAVGAPLEAPFTGRACVAYEYDIKQSGEAQSSYAGMALAPCLVDTTRGAARLLGWAVLDQFPPAPPQTIDRARGVSYLRGSGFEPLGLAGLVSGFGELLADDDGTLREDFRKTEDAIALDGCSIVERVVPVGTIVTILGRWSAARQGFTSAGSTTLNRVFPGDLQSTSKNVSGTSVKTFAAGLFFFVALHAILVPMYFLAPRPGGTASVWDERDCDRQKKLLAAGADPNEQDKDGLTPLMNSARYGLTPCVQQLLAAGAQLETADKNGETAFAQAVMAGRDEVVEILRRAGAKDFRVTAATGKPVTDVSEPFTVVEAYIAAIHRGDLETMARLDPRSSLARMEERRADLPVWQSMRPKVPVLAEGWMSEEAATVTVRGATPLGDRRVCYQLEDSSAGWRIMKEWFPDDR
jgi:hypothetical protein